MADVLDAFDEADPDGMVIPLFPDEAASLIKQAAGRDGLGGVTKIGSPAILETEVLALPESEGFYFSGPDSVENTNQATGRSATDIFAELEAISGGPPASLYWAPGYDATILLLSAIKQVTVSNGDTLHIDHEELCVALDGTEGFQGILGTLTCDDFGGCGTNRSVTDSSLLPIVY